MEQWDLDKLVCVNCFTKLIRWTTSGSSTTIWDAANHSNGKTFETKNGDMVKSTHSAENHCSSFSTWEFWDCASRAAAQGPYDPSVLWKVFPCQLHVIQCKSSQAGARSSTRARAANPPLHRSSCPSILYNWCREDMATMPPVFCRVAHHTRPLLGLR